MATRTMSLLPRLRRATALKLVLALIVAGAGLLSALPEAGAVVAVTPASGGTGISADTAGGAYTNLGAITTAEGVEGDFAISQTGATLILSAPAGFAFNAAQTPSINAPAGDITALSVGITAGAITVTFTTDGIANGGLDSIVIGATTAIQVRPTAGTPLAGGTILRTSGSPGTAAITGITNDVTNFGTLSEANGALANFLVELQGGGAIGTQTAGGAFNIQVTARDQFTNTVNGTKGARTSPAPGTK